MNSPEIVFTVNISYQTDESLNPVYPTDLRTIPFEVSEVFQLVVLRGPDLPRALRAHQAIQRFLDLEKSRTHVSKVQTSQCTHLFITCKCCCSVGAVVFP